MRLHEFTIALIDKGTKDRAENLGIKLEAKPDLSAKLTIDLDKVTLFREAHSDDEEDGTLGKSVLVYVGGDDFWLDVPYEEFKKIMEGK